MFGMGFGEILLVVIVAIIFLGPDKLPETMVNIAKFIRSVKKSVTEAKDSLESELKISELKEEALEYKEKIKKEAENIYGENEKESREIKEIFSDLKKDAQDIKKL